jgi:hypothetical protein
MGVMTSDSAEAVRVVHCHLDGVIRHFGEAFQPERSWNIDWHQWHADGSKLLGERIPETLRMESGSPGAKADRC